MTPEERKQAIRRKERLISDLDFEILRFQSQPDKTPEENERDDRYMREMQKCRNALLVELQIMKEEES